MERELSVATLYPINWASWFAQLIKILPAMQIPSSIPGLESSHVERIGYLFQYSWASLVAQTPAMQEIWVWSPGWEDTLEEGMANPLQYPCLENPHGQRSLVGYRPWGHKELDTTERLSTAQHSILLIVFKVLLYTCKLDLILNSFSFLKYLTRNLQTKCFQFSLTLLIWNQ